MTLTCKYEQPLSSSWQMESEKRRHGSNPGNRKGFHHSPYAVISFQISLCHPDLCLAGIKADIILEGSRISPDDNNLPGVKNKCKPDNWWSEPTHLNIPSPTIPTAGAPRKNLPYPILVHTQANCKQASVSTKNKQKQGMA